DVGGGEGGGAAVAPGDRPGEVRGRGGRVEVEEGCDGERTWHGLGGGVGGPGTDHRRVLDGHPVAGAGRRDDRTAHRLVDGADEVIGQRAGCRRILLIGVGAEHLVSARRARGHDAGRAEGRSGAVTPVDRARVRGDGGGGVRVGEGGHHARGR